MRRGWRIGSDRGWKMQQTSNERERYYGNWFLFLEQNAKALLRPDNLSILNVTCIAYCVALFLFWMGVEVEDIWKLETYNKLHPSSVTNGMGLQCSKLVFKNFPCCNLLYFIHYYFAFIKLCLFLGTGIIPSLIFRFKFKTIKNRPYLFIYIFHHQ